MSPATLTLHTNLLRAVKAIVAAWEEWVKSHR